MDANLNSGGADCEDVLGAPIEFWRLDGELYHRHPETGRVFRIVVDVDALAASLANPGDEEPGHIAGADEPVDSERQAEILADVDRAVRFREIPRGQLTGKALTPVLEDQLDPRIADDVLEIADEIEDHVVAAPLPRPALAPVEPILPLSEPLVLAVVVARRNLSAKQICSTLQRRGVTAELSDVGMCLAKLQRDGKVGSSRHGARSQSLSWYPTDRGIGEVGERIRPALRAVAAD